MGTTYKGTGPGKKLLYAISTQNQISQKKKWWIIGTITPHFWA